MTTPVVAPRSGLNPLVLPLPPTPEQPPRKKQHRHWGDCPRGWRWSWNNAALRVSGISRASGLPRADFRPAGAGGMLRMPFSGCHGCRRARNFQPPLPQQPSKRYGNSVLLLCVVPKMGGCERIPLRHRGNLELKNIIVIPEFSAWLTLVLEQCRAENIRNLPRQRAPTPLFPERRPREACSMPISGCHALPLATFNLPSRNNLQNKRQQRPPTKQKNQPPRLPRRRAGCRPLLRRR